MKTFLDRLQPRERRLVLLAASVGGLALVWVGVWEPLREARQAAYDQLGEQRALLDWLDRAAPEVRQLRAQARSGRTVDGRSTLALIDQSARSAGLAGSMKRIEPSTGGEVRVAFEGAAFPDLMNWLAALVSDQPFAVVRVDADRAEVGRVDASVVLRRLDVSIDAG
jgi:general secretion pathway protein M